MNYYPFHLGDYAAHTAHLEPMEDLAYRRMLDLYYLRESALPQDPAEVARLIRMRSNVAEVEAVLREFFTSDGVSGWVHMRCEAEISRMQDKQAKAKASADASVKARQAKALHPHSEGKADAERTLNERSTDVELPTPTPTPTPTPETKTPRKRGAAAQLVSVEQMVAEGVDPQCAADWLAARKAKDLTLTVTAWQQTREEAVKAGLPIGEAIRVAAGNSWGGFKASWLASANAPARLPPASKQAALEARNAAVVQSLMQRRIANEPR